MQILLLQTFSTCFVRHAPIIRSVKKLKTTHTHTHTCKLQQNMYIGQLVSVSLMLYITELPVPVAVMSVFYTPDDGRMTPETSRESLK